MPRRPSGGATVWAVAALSVAAALGVAALAAAPETPIRGGTFRYGISEPGSLDPALARTTFDQAVVLQYQIPLLRVWRAGQRP